MTSWLREPRMALFRSMYASNEEDASALVDRGSLELLREFSENVGD